MERALWTRVGMVLSIFVLVVVILVTPYLLGRPTSELGSLPLLVIGMSTNGSTFIVNVGAAVSEYRYKEIRLTLTASQLWNGSQVWMNRTLRQNDTYGAEAFVPSNATFTVDSYFVDQSAHYFEYNVTAHTGKDADGRTVMIFRFPEPDNMNTEVRTYPPEDFRWPIPSRGTLP